MSSRFEQSGGVTQFYDDLKAIRKIVLKLQRTMDTDGCYNPFNRHAEAAGRITSEIRSKLEREVA